MRLTLAALIIAVALIAGIASHIPPTASADFCFGPGNQREGFACNSACYGVPDPDFNSLPLPCPGPAASIKFEPASLLTAYCGSQSTLSVVVTDAKGNAVANDTEIKFTTDGGSVGATSATRGGLAMTTFSVHAKTSGVAHVVASVGNIRAEREVHVGCFS
jgi:hypothetical protein